eukprot:CAMPEP_0206310016 /NCGR_PEP_ID=MMETSP0106_2-20121207/12697_1 /ASSEMBLY_ACC=CAM_ASM_000206 /TAXON_ID=81532 /ORGANISM="Acanthoeca-like sp., Strain 10tr" /LENGTH=107 /DNA_ID=CAMNT_0053741153 /DNA_START=270 /DNA_END=593 /DNA_ORIENTATION=-
MAVDDAETLVGDNHPKEITLLAFDRDRERDAGNKSLVKRLTREAVDDAERPWGDDDGAWVILDRHTFLGRDGSATENPNLALAVRKTDRLHCGSEPGVDLDRLFHSL